MVSDLQIQCKNDGCEETKNFRRKVRINGFIKSLIPQRGKILNYETQKIDILIPGGT